MKHNYTDIVALAKSVTELAIQRNMIPDHGEVEPTAKEVAKFYNAFVEAIENPDTN